MEIFKSRYHKFVTSMPLTHRYGRYRSRTHNRITVSIVSPLLRLMVAHAGKSKMAAEVTKLTKTKRVILLENYCMLQINRKSEYMQESVFDSFGLQLQPFIRVTN